MNPLAPVTGLIDATEDLLGHSPHPAIVSVPIGAWVVSNVCDGWALAAGDRRLDDAARWSMGIGLASAAVAAVTGLRDYSAIPTDRPSHPVATTHALGNKVVLTLYGTSFLLRVRDHEAGRRPSLAARALSLAGAGMATYAAWLGGRLVEEFGEAVQPVMDRLSEEEHGESRHKPTLQGSRR
jgi:uncharacterized membrane protein